MKFEREWTAEQVADVIRRRVAGESDRAIGRALGRQHTTVGRLLRAPDIAPILQEELARIDRAAVEREREAADAIRREEQRKRDRDRKRADRAAKQAEQEGRPPEQVERIRSRGKRREPAKPKSKGPILAVIGMPGPAGIRAGQKTEVLWSRDHSAALDDSITEEQWRDLPREPWLPDLSVVHIETPTLRCGLRLWSDDPFDREDVWARADDIAAELGLTRNAVVERIYSAKPGQTVRFEPTSEPEPAEASRPSGWPSSSDSLA